jgi:hypothetical protein
MTRPSSSTTIWSAYRTVEKPVRDQNGDAVFRQRAEVLEDLSFRFGVLPDENPSAGNLESVRHAEARGPMGRSGDLSTPNHGRGGARLCRWRDGGQNTYPRRTVGERRNVGAYLTFALYHWPFA